MTSIVESVELQPRDSENDGRSRLTPELYARLVLGFAKQAKNPLYPGRHYTVLARFLISPYQRLTTDDEEDASKEISLNTAYVYDLAKDSNTPERIQIFSSTDDIDKYDDERRKKQQGGRVVFLQGYQSPKWLNHIGSKFEVDPEFYLRHLDFSSAQSSPEHYHMLSLPSAAEIIRIRITSIMSWNNFQPSIHHTTTSLRSACEKQMREYMKNLGKFQDIVPSDSIVRRFSVFDTHHFAIEQVITVHINYDSPGWTALIWLDHGRDLHLSRHGPWKDLQRGNSSALTTQPIIQHRKRIALLNGGVDSRPPVPNSTPSGHPIASFYGRSLRPEVMVNDTFYALDEIFRLAIAAESQFLTFASHKIKRAISDDQVQDLHHVLALIEDHREQLRENLASVKAGGHARWPKASNQLRTVALDSKERLQKDLEHLLVYAGHLADRCTGGISVMMNEAMFEQSQRAVEQTKATNKLSLLVFFFAPLSVTTSFFSMSVKEIGGDSDLSVWVWAVASAGTLGLSFVLWKWNPVELARGALLFISGLFASSSTRQHT